MVPEEFSEAVEAELVQVIGEAASEFPEATVTVRRILLARPLVPLDGGRHLTEILCRRATEIMGEVITAKGVPLYTDARHYAEKGIPIVLSARGHGQSRMPTPTAPTSACRWPTSTRPPRSSP